MPHLNGNYVNESDHLAGLRAAATAATSGVGSGGAAGAQPTANEENMLARIPHRIRVIQDNNNNNNIGSHRTHPSPSSPYIKATPDYSKLPVKGIV